MKYPNDFVTFRNGPHPQGRTDRDALVEVDAPYLSKLTPGGLTRKQGEFYDHKRAPTSTPTLAMWWGADSGFYLAKIDIEGYGTVRRPAFTRFPELDAPTTAFSARVKYLGGKHLGCAMSTIDVTDSAVYWPCIFSTTGPVRQRLLSEGEDLGSSVSYIDTHQVTGWATAMASPEWHALGWSGDAYRAAYTFSFKINEDYVAPVVYTWDSATQALVQRSVPFYANRYNASFTPFVIGPGKIQALVSVLNKSDDPNPVLEPYFVTSRDHGVSWVFEAASDLEPFWVVGDPDTPETATGGGTGQRYWMAKHHLNIYLGQGKNLLVIPNGHVGGYSYRAMAFLGTDGGGYVRLTWPPDEWIVDSAGLRDPLETTSWLVLSSTDRDHQTAHFAFGEGCVALPVYHENIQRLLVTYDFGTTWAIVPLPALPETLPAGGAVTWSGEVIEPYESAERPGKLAFVYRHNAEGKVFVLTTDGTFARWRRTTGLLKTVDGEDLWVESGIYVDPQGVFNEYLTNFAGPVHPAFPGEFDKP